MSSFLQSTEWEQFQQSLGRKTWRTEGALVIRHDFPFGFNYLYSPRPKLVTNNWLRGVEKIAREEKSIFLKIDPLQKFSIFNFQFSISDSIQPQKTVVLDLTKSEDALMAAMHEKTRYNIRLAERRGVTAHKTHNAQHDFEMFWGLLQETARRDGFHTHDRAYYEKLLQTRSEDFSNELFLAEYQGKLLAAALVNFYRGLFIANLRAASPHEARVATYLHGASSREHKDVMAPHLLHWRIIQEAKRRGLQSYDFWGIDEKKWPGLTRFKTGFGGAVVEYPPAVDVVCRGVFYKAYRLAKKTIPQ